MYTRIPGLGLIPSWQFDMTAANPKINPHVTYPEGMTQQSVQSGMGGVFDSWAWTNRKIIVGGGLAVAAIGAAALVLKVLR